MKTIKSKIAVTGFILFFLLQANFSNCLAQCGNHGEQSAGNSHAAKADTVNYYACPMHPEIQSTFPTTCPKCGMELVQTSGNEKHRKQRMGMMGMGAMGVVMIAMMAFMIAGGAVYLMSR